ncbi:hypothetical protein [Agarilytica rhodophyticola]|uniref:hypothetical protein n=1 Tax=Agarilytica rhodophyticola TaxID=1737490 RepID=UPI000B3481EF|nr:hypothetical protein [Agarilytica rhodophyticola]
MLLFKYLMKKKTIAVLCLILSVGNAVLSAILMDMFWGTASAAPEWVKYFVIIYIVVPMAYSYKLIIEGFGKK